MYISCVHTYEYATIQHGSQYRIVKGEFRMHGLRGERYTYVCIRKVLIIISFTRNMVPSFFAMHKAPIIVGASPSRARKDLVYLFIYLSNISHKRVVD